MENSQPERGLYISTFPRLRSVVDQDEWRSALTRGLPALRPPSTLGSNPTSPGYWPTNTIMMPEPAPS